MALSDGLKKLEKYSAYEKEFDQFYQAHEKIVIFGTGPCSAEVTKYFNHRKLKFEFYCVTKRRTVPVPNIKEFDEIKDEIDDSFRIVVAMNNGDIAIAHLRSRNFMSTYGNPGKVLKELYLRAIPLKKLAIINCGKIHFTLSVPIT